MAATAAPLANGTAVPSAKPIQLAIPQPHAPGSRIHLHLTILQTTLVLFLTNSHHESSGPSALGSFVYAMPDRYNPSQPLSTPLYTLPSSLDFATRMARLLARKTGKAVHVGSSVSFAGAAGGGTVEEEMEAFGAVVKTVLAEVGRVGAGARGG